MWFDSKILCSSLSKLRNDDVVRETARVAVVQADHDHLVSHLLRCFDVKAWWPPQGESLLADDRIVVVQGLESMLKDRDRVPDAVRCLLTLQTHHKTTTLSPTMAKSCGEAAKHELNPEAMANLALLLVYQYKSSQQLNVSLLDRNQTLKGEFQSYIANAVLIACSDDELFGSSGAWTQIADRLLSLR